MVKVLLVVVAARLPWLLKWSAGKPSDRRPRPSLSKSDHLAHIRLLDKGKIGRKSRRARNVKQRELPRWISPRGLLHSGR